MVNAVLERLYQANTVTHRDGKARSLCPPGMTPERGEYLFTLVRELRPAVTLEIGLAYGLSTLFIAEGLRRNGSGRHIAIDPNQRRRFDGLGLRHLEEAGLAGWVDFREEGAEFCLPRLVDESVQLDLAVNDSGHLFDHVILESVYLALLLRVGGVLVFDDPGLPGVARACDFLATNRRDFVEIVAPTGRPLIHRLLGRRSIPPPPRNPRGKPLMRTFQKVVASDPRGWDEFTSF